MLLICLGLVTIGAVLGKGWGLVVKVGIDGWGGKGGGV
jgi:hypothetical protein